MPELKRPVNKRENPPEKVKRGTKGPMAGKMTMPSPTRVRRFASTLNRPVPGLMAPHKGRRNPVKDGY